MKHIFVTGGVVSSLGKGLTAAALGALLEQRGISVYLQKFDPYLNVDPGTMSPFQHGEVYVLSDGAETDLDLGHYERFTNTDLSRLNSLSSGQVYERVIQNERKGIYLGKTVQVIPHVTNEIKDRLYAASEKADVIITEIGGTTGDIEGLPFIEAIRQFALEVGKEHIVFLHVTLIPYLKAVEELKTKPTQQSVARLREIGIQPDLLICRTEQPLTTEIRQKISLFCNVPLKAVIEQQDVSSIYELPLTLKSEGVDELIIQQLGLQTMQPSGCVWEQVVQRLKYPRYTVRIAIVGKYMELKDAYKSVYESLTHAGIHNDAQIEVVSLDAEALEIGNFEESFQGIDGILVPGGFGGRGIEGKLKTITYARTYKIPYFGICLGMQAAVIEFARSVVGLTDANSEEFAEDTQHPVIALLEAQKQVTNKGATMRLGAYECHLIPGTHAQKAYGQSIIQERHRHRYEFNDTYRTQLTEKGLVISGTNPDTGLVEIIELKDHPWFVAVQFHPEFQSKPQKAHPLFADFVKAALEKKELVGSNNGSHFYS